MNVERHEHDKLNMELRQFFAGTVNILLGIPSMFKGKDCLNLF